MPAAGRRTGRRSTRRDPAATRGRILAAAFDAFGARGFSGARIDAIAHAARANIRMIYHYFGGKAPLYVAALEQGLAELRAEEHRLAIDDGDPVEGLLKLFDFVFGHFATHPRLVSLLTSENLQRAGFLKRSRRVAAMASPTIDIIRGLLRRAGRRAGGLDPLQLYVTMVALSYFHLSNVHTLSVLFRRDLSAPAWIEARRRHARDVLRRYLEAVL